MSKKSLQFANNHYYKAYLRKSTVELVQLIAGESDRTALRVLLDTRRLFSLKNKTPLLLPEFLMKLKDSLAVIEGKYDIKASDFAECVYDLTLAKFSNFPDHPKKSSNSKMEPVRGTGIDCRNCYRAFLRAFQQRKDTGEITSNLHEESEVGLLLQQLVYKNFLWSKLECMRDNPFSRRYNWEIKGMKIYLWYPSHMTAKEFKEWLNSNIKDLDPTNQKNEQKRIQSIIDKNLIKGYQISLEGSGLARTKVTKEEPSSIESLEGHMFGRNLAYAVAHKKIKNIHKLRPAIRKLGRKELKQLILKIFSEIEHGDYDITRVAEEYGISKATLSRFAGSTWFEKMQANNLITIPDLWKNTAKILGQNPVFMETVITSGFAVQLEEALRIIEEDKGKRND